MEWIKVKDKKPELGIKHRYLFVNGKGEVTYGYAYSTENEHCIWINDMDRETNEIARYWMKLPDPPKKE